MSYAFGLTILSQYQVFCEHMHYNDVIAEC